MSTGETVAVKVLATDSRQGEKEFQSERHQGSWIVHTTKEECDLVCSWRFVFESAMLLCHQDEKKLLARSERVAIHVSNIANLVLFMAKVYASVESRSLAASTLDSSPGPLIRVYSVVHFNAMKTPNQYHYPIGKKRMQPVDQWQPEHVITFLLAELGTSGSLDGQQRFVVKGGFTPKFFEGILRRYVNEYVICNGCKSPNTILSKEN